MNEIKKIRQEYKLTQKELAKKTLIPIGTIQNWEQEKRKPPVYIIPMIKVILNNEQ